MEKSLYTREYAVLLKLLTGSETRRAAGVTQIQLAQRLAETQSQVSKLERGEVRLDLIELRTVCHGCQKPSRIARFRRCPGCGLISVRGRTGETAHRAKAAEMNLLAAGGQAIRGLVGSRAGEWQLLSLG